MRIVQGGGAATVRRVVYNADMASDTRSSIPNHSTKIFAMHMIERRSGKVVNSKQNRLKSTAIYLYQVRAAAIETNDGASKSECMVLAGASWQDKLIAANIGNLATRVPNSPIKPTPVSHVWC